MMMRAAEEEWLEENQVIPPDVMIMSLGMFSQGHMWLHAGISLWREFACIYMYASLQEWVSTTSRTLDRHTHCQQVSTLLLLLWAGWMFFKGCWYLRCLAFSFSVFSCLFSVLPCPVLFFFLRSDHLACPDWFHLVLFTLPHLIYHSLKCVFSLLLAVCCMCMCKLAPLLCVSGTECDQHTHTHWTLSRAHTDQTNLILILCYFDL